MSWSMVISILISIFVVAIITFLIVYWIVQIKKNKVEDRDVKVKNSKNGKEKW